MTANANQASNDLSSGSVACAKGSYAVTPSNSTILSPVARALYIGVSGDVAVIHPDGTTGTFKAVPVGILPVSATQVLLTGTAATDIRGLY